jgi:hypothetical protein
MTHHHTFSALLLTAAFVLSLSAARAFDEEKYPNWKGQWVQVGGGAAAAWDPTKPPGAGQEAPLTTEYQAQFRASVAGEAKGGPPVDPTAMCIPAGMPRVMMAIHPMEIVITPAETYFMFAQFNTLRGIYTDGRRFPDQIQPSFIGYSIGHWQATGGGGRFDTLVIETHAIKGPHTYDGSGIPFHEDGELTVTEKLYTDKTDPNVLHDEITTNDHALTRPWTVTRSYRRDPRQTEPDWQEVLCKPDTGRVLVGEHYYRLSPDGLLMPAIKGQQPPDLKYFKTAR